MGKCTNYDHDTPKPLSAANVEISKNNAPAPENTPKKERKQMRVWGDIVERSRKVLYRIR